MQENMFSMNWVYMSQVNVIWPDSIKCNLLSCTHVIKLCGKFTCNHIQGQHFGHKYFLSVVRLCRLYQFLGFTYHGITIIRKWSGLHQVLKLFMCHYVFAEVWILTRPLQHLKSFSFKPLVVDLQVCLESLSCCITQF